MKLSLTWSAPAAATVLVLALSACQAQQFVQSGGKAEASPELARLQVMIGRFAPSEISADAARLEPGDRRALDKIIDAAALMNPLFRRQVWSGNDVLLQELKGDANPVGRARLRYFLINVGPWSRLDKNEPFIAGVPPEKPPQAAFYPEDMTKGEFETWVKGLPDAERKNAQGFFHVIRRGSDGKLKAVPYSEEYREFLEPAARLLREAAGLTADATLKKFLTSRADAFASNDYYASDIAWMELDAPIDVTIGPYETYEDEFFNYKAAFEAYVTLRDDAESDKLQKFAGYLQELEDHLPIDARCRNPKLGASAPIRVVDEVFASGDGNRGVQTAAFNLPNDDRVIREKGSKRIMLKNVQEAKFKQTLRPISKVMLGSAQQNELSFDAFFTHILAHELMHGLGPHNIKVGADETTVRGRLKELYSAIEEAKADVTGLWALQYLIDKGVVDRQLKTPMYTTFLASMFRSVRFGVTEAHGKGVALQFNYLLDEGAIHADEAAGTFRVDTEKIKPGVAKLAHDLLTLEAEGNYQRAREMLDKYAVVRPVMQKTLDRLKQVPVDIQPRFPLAEGRDRRD